MTLMIQPAENGGIFQIPANTRSASLGNYHQVKQGLTRKQEDTIVSVRREPGALFIFKSCYSLHRVSLTWVISNTFGGDLKVDTTIFGPLTLGK